MCDLRFSEYGARKRFGLTQDEPLNEEGIKHLILCELELLKQAISKKTREEVQLDIKALTVLLEASRGRTA